MLKRLGSILKSEYGPTTEEYALVLALIIVLGIATVTIAPAECK